jgi:hypothetical protein
LANEALFTGTCLKSTDCLQMLAKIILLWTCRLILQMFVFFLLTWSLALLCLLFSSFLHNFG